MKPRRSARRRPFIRRAQRDFSRDSPGGQDGAKIANHRCISAVKATLLGGAVFLIPAFIVFFVLAKVFGDAEIVRRRARPAARDRERPRRFLAGRGGDRGSVTGLLPGGLVARQATAQRLRSKLDEALLASFPGYAFVKGLAENIHKSEEIASSFVPVLVEFRRLLAGGIRDRPFARRSRLRLPAGAPESLVGQRGSRAGGAGEKAAGRGNGGAEADSDARQGIGGGRHGNQNASKVEKHSPASASDRPHRKRGLLTGKSAQ